MPEKKIPFDCPVLTLVSCSCSGPRPPSLPPPLASRGLSPAWGGSGSGEGIKDNHYSFDCVITSSLSCFKLYLQVLFALFALFPRRVRHRRPASHAAEDNAGRTGAKDVHAGPVRPGSFHTQILLRNYCLDKKKKENNQV